MKVHESVRCGKGVGLQLALARSCALLPVTAWKPVLILATEQRE